jgi:hypothetical protein
MGSWQLPLKKGTCREHRPRDSGGSLERARAVTRANIRPRVDQQTFADDDKIFMLIDDN